MSKHVRIEVVLDESIEPDQLEAFCQKMFIYFSPDAKRVTVATTHDEESVMPEDPTMVFPLPRFQRNVHSYVYERIDDAAPEAP